MRTIFLTILLGAGLGACDAGTELPSAVSPGKVHAPPKGEFALITARRAGDVAGGPIEAAATERIGETVSFGDTLTWWDGTHCKEWTAEPLEEPILPLDDPNLSDTQVPPLDGPVSSGDRRLNQSWSLTCDGKPLGVLLQVDRRVLVIPTRSGVTNVILEEPLLRGVIWAFQKQLKDMKFYSGEPSSRWDEESLAAVASYAEYRGARFRFSRPAITENLLDGLNVIRPSIKDRFPDYKPKETPDTLLDYRPALGVEMASLPAARLKNLKALLKAHREWREKARTSPGVWEEGSIPLGADPKEYVPSDAELMAGEVCGRIQRVASEASATQLSEALTRQKIRIRKIECVHFAFRHVDVMGSGRFFYASPPKRIVIELRLAG